MILPKKKKITFISRSLHQKSIPTDGNWMALKPHRILTNLEDYKSFDHIRQQSV